MNNIINSLVIHGHFYQPPRENPWSETIERQISASPYHNWNEKVAAECYTPNSVSRIIGNENRIVDIVNNYEKISFNFGPTLLSWMQQKLPHTYHAIIEADKHSRERFSGHGNAIAQAYNHMILPLANHQDKVTQVKWGLADFKYRFKRNAEAMWLPETAINYPTIEVLIDHGLKFIILSPFQALRVSPLKKTGKWVDVSSGNINITQPYRCFFIDQHGKKSRDKYIDVVFYHAGLSNGVAFEHLLRDAINFADKIKATFQPNRVEPQLISICTDGESYGHHEPFGDIGLAYLLHREVNHKDLHITNYAEYLEQHPPQMEVELKPGPNGEGTSWSCFHGVGRWYRDCGCSSGGQPEWNQKWRWHLRNALDKLRDELVKIFEKKGANYFNTPWQARNDYIHVILDRSDQSVTEFFNNHANHDLTPKEKSDSLSLLEMQRHAMLMYTSCGWFFADISGIEAVQILKYAARALELGEKFTESDLELVFLSELNNAKSNIKILGSGKDVFENFVKPSVVTSAQIINHYAILSTLEKYKGINSVYNFNINKKDYEQKSGSNHSLIIGNLEINSDITKENEEYAFALLYRSNEIYKCAVKSVSDVQEYPQLKSDTFTIFQKNENQFWQQASKFWGNKTYSISDILYEEREQLYSLILKDILSNLQQNYQNIYQQNKKIIIELNKLGIPVPIELQIPAELSLSLQLEQEIKNALKDFKFNKAREIVNLAEELNFQLSKDKPQQYFQELMEQKAKLLYETLNNQLIDEMLQIWEIITNLKLKINKTLSQNYLFRILHEKLPSIIDEIVSKNVIDSRYYFVYSVLRLAYNLNFDISDLKEKLKPLEQMLSENPDFWP